LYNNNNNNLTQTQNGFREGQSTETSIRDFLESIQKATGVKMKTLQEFFDLSKVYDEVTTKSCLLN